ncbi:hypothetical protein RFI_34653 [Reticulomyxa filosa]|uniref:Uncharacterized protein n=1 Tax=Reticulomyxa filosa TaxID=46433 RepID=X6LPT8_RETFI|nr:hypothetical protein RFI_34653 [Reticulomyxa filosa]|eukprot:ETO02760.1 hypothetical protein RFI_34653 [Reticulomyxa filosa]
MLVHVQNFQDRIIFGISRNYFAWNNYNKHYDQLTSSLKNQNMIIQKNSVIYQNEIIDISLRNESVVITKDYMEDKKRKDKKVYVKTGETPVLLDSNALTEIEMHLKFYLFGLQTTLLKSISFNTKILTNHLLLVGIYYKSKALQVHINGLNIIYQNQFNQDLKIIHEERQT